jgi:hypothetical protein
MSEKQKIYVLVVAVAIAALVAYLRFFRDPAPQAVTPPGAEAQATPLADGSAARRLDPAAGRAHRMSALQPAGEIRDLFAPVGPLPHQPLAQAPTTAMQPNEVLTLDGTVTDGDTAMAIINNRFFRQGQTVAGFRVEKITHDRVYLLSGDHRKVLDVMPLKKEIP